MLKNEMQHQFWITKKTVQRKLGSKEDEHVISSDAELDAKIEVFKSIAETSTVLNKIIDQYLERLCILSQEESIFGRFLKEAGKRSNTTSQSILSTGKSVSYCGQQRMCVRVPLLRLQHEVEIYRDRAVSDTQATITAMEKERTEYRAALAWMKSSSSELDPDTGRGVDKFRTAQSHVRAAKQNFDSLSMDTVQKIDLLAAARCNMYSHVLVSYMADLKQFAVKTAEALETISKTLKNKPRYDFCILKELTHFEETEEESAKTDNSNFDKDQSLFFAFDYEDTEKNETQSNVSAQDILPNIAQMESYKNDIMDLLTKGNDCDDFFPYNDNMGLNDASKHPETNDCKLAMELEQQKSTKDVSSALYSPPSSSISNRKKTPAANTSKQTSWAELFAELDPLGNLDAFDMQMSGVRKNFQQT